MASESNLLALQSLSRQNSVGFSQVDLTRATSVTTSHLIMHPSPLVIICYAGSGRLKRIQRAKSRSLLRSDLLYSTMENQIDRFVVPLPKESHAKQIGESHFQAVLRFLTFERSLRSKNQFDPFSAVMEEYFKMGHAEAIPEVDLEKHKQDVFYLLIHAARKEFSSTTKIRAVFDTSAKSSSDVFLNNTLLVGPTVHSCLIDVLLRFRFHCVALTSDVSRMYRAVQLTPYDRDIQQASIKSSHLPSYNGTGNPVPFPFRSRLTSVQLPFLSVFKPFPFCPTGSPSVQVNDVIKLLSH